MGTLSRHIDGTASAASAAATAAYVAAAEAAADTAPGASGGAESDQGGTCTAEGAAGKEHQASTWGTPRTEQMSVAADAQSPATYSGGSAATKEEQLLLQQLQQQQQEDESEGELRNEVVPSCVICGKNASKSDAARGLSWTCESCSSKQKQQEAPDEIQEEGLPDAPAQTPSAAPDGTEAPQSCDGGIETAEYNTPKVPGTSRSTSSSSSGGGNGSATAAARGRGSAGGAQPAAAAASRKCIDEGSVRRHVVPVGPRHQVPCLPPFFLEGGGLGCCCGGESAPVLDPSLTAKLVYSPSSLERVRQRRLAEGLADRAICSEGDMEAFMQQCAKNWKANKPGWQPFSPEFAFKLLHYAGYDPAKALQLMEDPQFPFQLVCDGPVRRYDNKWRPKDRRGVISPTPYPPPVFLRGYLSRRHYRDSSGYSLR